MTETGRYLPLLILFLRRLSRLGRFGLLRRRLAGAACLRGFWLEEALGFSLELGPLLAQHRDILAALDAFGLVGVARDRDVDRDLDFRVQRDRDLVQADGLDRRMERDLIARGREAIGGRVQRGVGRRDLSW